MSTFFLIGEEKTTFQKHFCKGVNGKVKKEY